MVHTRPLGSSERLPSWPVAMYPDSRKCTESEGEAPLFPFAGFGVGLWVGEVQVCCMDCYSYFLRQREVSEQCSPSLDCIIAGAPEVQGSCSSMVRLYVSFPLKLSVSEGLSLSEGFVRGYPGGYGCRRGVLKEGPEVRVGSLQEFVVASLYGCLNPIRDVLVIDD